MMRRRMVVPSLVSASVFGLVAAVQAPAASAVPAPEVEYTYDVMFRRHYDFPGNDALGYGYQLCDKVTQGQSYADVMRDVKADVTPNDEASANYLVSNAVGILCPAQIWQLRNSAANYRPPA
ncbi:DUF732 domain-containing protein [Mycolicibacterium sp. 050158]|uniref:DUF732 domain-containing protein n=1 Tax=Mycolicibacterium sp. 050158 TaxID=3090602 RepID=UPI00299E6844|nr:DUF732 domain-containing protein [Mycolicibacterium sp. 050158]MDX1888952.1 DUF732 domain-containing protein [Mycolicibacterium sp. 050158]